MNPEQHENTQSVLKAFFQRLGKGYIPVTKLVHSLTSKEKMQLKVKSKKSYTQKEIIDALGHIQMPFQVIKKGQSAFIVNKNPQDLVLELIAQKPGKTIGQIVTPGFPLKTELVINEANKLIRQGMVLAYIRPSQKVELRLSSDLRLKKHSEALPEPQTTMTPALDPIEKFKKAYDNVGQGKRFVEIFNIRRYLNWSREQFDSLLNRLMTEGHVVANLGNPGDLTQDEVLDSYQDEYGDLYITVTWR